MVDAPEKIWASSVTENYGEWQTTLDGMLRPTEYTRSDLVAELAAENERLKHRAEHYEKLSGERHLEIHRLKTEALASTGAVKVLSRLIERAQQIVSNTYAHWHYDAEEVLYALSSHPRDTNTVEDHETGNVRDKIRAAFCDGWCEGIGDISEDEQARRDDSKTKRLLDAADNEACDCTKIGQDESCPVGYPSLLCDKCDGRGVVESPAPEGQQKPDAYRFTRNGEGFSTNGDERFTSIPEGQQPVAWQAEERAWFDGRHHKRLFSEEPPQDDPRYRNIRPLYTRPSAPAVTETGINAAEQAMTAHYERPLKAWELTALRAALKAAMEAGR